ncbi:MAG: M23 family metallopeptidase [Phenylobacterium sp.]|nr:M23 family metallopeptidase [Phenylobacterium sp.]
MKFAPILLAGLVAACAPPTESEAQGAHITQTAPATQAAGLPLDFPVACTVGSSCEVQNYVDRDPGPEAKDYRCGSSTYEAHGGVDIRIPDMAAQAAGVDVLAAAAGKVARLRDGLADVSVRTRGAAALQGQDCGNGVVIDHGQGWETQYCHLAQGSLKVKVGDAVAAGTPIARIGLSGNTEYPHLHLTVRKDGVMVDPSSPEPGCDPARRGAGLWTPSAERAMAYKAGAVLNAGFAADAVDMAAIEAGGIAPPTTRTGLVAYVRAINLQGGDVQELTLAAPDGRVLVSSAQPALDRAKAQYMVIAGKRAQAAGWPPGRYVATYVVRRGGKAVISRTFAAVL